MLLLSACSRNKEEILSENEEFSYPKAVENEVISPEMYWQVRKFLSDVDTYSSPEYDYKTSILNMLEGDYNVDLINSYNNHLNERELMLKNQEITPITEVDKTLAGYMGKFIGHSNKNINHMRSFTKDFDFSYFDLAHIESEMANDYMEDFLVLLETYELTNEAVK